MPRGDPGNELRKAGRESWARRGAGLARSLSVRGSSPEDLSVRVHTARAFVFLHPHPKTGGHGMGATRRRRSRKTPTWERSDSTAQGAIGPDQLSPSPSLPCGWAQAARLDSISQPPLHTRSGQATECAPAAGDARLCAAFRSHAPRQYLPRWDTAESIAQLPPHTYESSLGPCVSVWIRAPAAQTSGLPRERETNFSGF